MVRVYLEFKNNKWERVAKSDFWIDKKLLEILDNIKMIKSKGWDAVLIIDGKERAGKSSLGMICGWYLSNCKMNENNFARGLSDCAEKIAKIEDGSVIQVDEGSTMFLSKDSSTSEQKKLIKILDVVGQKNLIFIICLPCFFDLNKTIAVRRSIGLLHVYPDEEYNRGQYAYWGEMSKKSLYKIGKKNFDSYAFPNANFVGEYFQFEPPFYLNYLKKVKQETLNDVLQDAISGDVTNKRLIHNAIVKCKYEISLRLQKYFKEIKNKKNVEKISQRDLAKVLEVSRDMIRDFDMRGMPKHTEVQKLWYT